MRITGVIILAVATAGLWLPEVFAKGFLGERYFGADGGWERMENAVSDDGWRVGAELNIPAPIGDRMPFSADLNISGNYRDLFDSDVYDVAGLLRGYSQRDSTVMPFVGAGFGWVDYDAFDTTFVPVEAGLEFRVADASILPFFRYNFALQSGVDNFWTVGARGVYWVNDAWGVTVSGDYTDYDNLGGVEKGWTARAGLVFSY